MLIHITTQGTGNQKVHNYGQQSDPPKCVWVGDEKLVALWRQLASFPGHSPHSVEQKRLSIVVGNTCTSYSLHILFRASRTMAAFVP